MEFSFATDAKSQPFCEGIVRAMSLLYDVAPAEALAIINAHWKGLDILSDSIVFHETEWYWADHLANPNPYQDSNHPEQVAWKQRDAEARDRFAQLERPAYAVWPTVPS